MSSRSTKTGVLSAGDQTLGQALADVASIALVQGRLATDRVLGSEELQRALDSRVVLEQAKGLRAQLGNPDMEQTFVVLRRYARDHKVALAVLASALVSRELPADVVLAMPN